MFSDQLLHSVCIFIRKQISIELFDRQKYEQSLF